MQSVTKLSSLSGASDTLCASYVRVVSAVTLDRIYQLLAPCWGFSVVGCELGILDIRIRMYWTLSLGR
ncbi:hypothetical protein PC119_g15591 [Phytophthora cactorum]|uniref:Uncharacterized protein n=1 Tax=Phytophthora cactorum TaxID=29920 RepID=A0A8T0YV56_9STRA|nr:hypothetical protein PC113_g14772 [Phytophthora cactorum]KAG3004589.1 hypothetical protein PC119_g15591 [Phytophthora cactorum]